MPFFFSQLWEPYPKLIEANYQVKSHFNPIWKDKIEKKKLSEKNNNIALLQSTLNMCLCK